MDMCILYFTDKRLYNASKSGDTAIVSECLRQGAHINSVIDEDEVGC